MNKIIWLKAFILLFLAAIIATILFSHFLKDTRAKNINFFNANGFYVLENNHLLLIEDEYYRISYTLIDAKHKTRLIHQNSVFDDVQRWFIVWENNSLWVHSNDVGSVVWKKGEDGQYTQTPVSAELCSEMPINFKINLPESLKTLWNCKYYIKF